MFGKIDMKANDNLALKQVWKITMNKLKIGKPMQFFYVR